MALAEQLSGLTALQVVYETHARDCVRCGLSTNRKKVVFGTGNSENPEIAFLSGGATDEETEKGFPLIDDEGQLFDNILTAAGLHRLDVYILNSVACPSLTGGFEADELAACWPVMAAQLKAVQPKTIVCMGGVAARQLLQVKESVTDLRKRWHSWDNIPVRVTYHPRYLLRTTSMKGRVWADIKNVLLKLGKTT